MVNGKVLLVFGLVIATVLTTLAPVVSASSGNYKAISIELRDYDNRPFANERVMVIIWNETSSSKYPGGYPLAYFDGTTDKNGKLLLKFTGISPLPIDPSVVDPATTYNITIAIRRYDKWFLLYQRSGIDYATLKTHFNTTITAEHWWGLRFKAVDYKYPSEVLYTPGFYGADYVSFKVYLAGSLVMTIDADATDTAKKIFNISDTELTFKTVREGWILVASRKNVTLVKETFWNLYKNEKETLSVLVGKDQIVLGTSSDYPHFYNVTDLITKENLGFGELTPVTEIEDRVYTRKVYIEILSPCGSFVLGDPTYWAVILQGEIDGKPVILRSGKPGKYGRAPESGYFRVPDVTTVYGKNLTVTITYYNVAVFTYSFNISTVKEPEPWEPEIIGLQPVLAEVEGDVFHIVAPTTVVWIRLRIMDMEPEPQPLAGAVVRIAELAPDLIPTVSGPDGYVMLPPFEIVGVAETPVNGVSHAGLVYRPVYEGFGLLPVHFGFRKLPDTLHRYTITVRWRTYNSEDWFDVTNTENATISINLFNYLKQISDEGECITLEFRHYARVFEIKALLLDQCWKPITSEDYPGARALIYVDDKLVAIQSPSPDGTVAFKFVPAGKLKLRLEWKGILMRANVTAPAEPEITFDKNLASDVPKFIFPIGRLILKLTMWDVEYPIRGLNVTIQYLKDGKIVHQEEWARTNCSGIVIFDKVPLKPLDEARNIIRVLAYTYATPYTRPIDSNLLVLNHTLAWGDFKIACVNEISLPTWIYSFKLLAVDHAGTVLEHFSTSVGSYPVTVILVDSIYEEQPSCCKCELPLFYVYENFRILNATTAKAPKAIFTYYSQQYFESDPEMDAVGIKPHMFIAGAKYYFMVFHGGVLVYNYTITLPRPYQTVTVLFNETSRKTEVVEGVALDRYTWTPHISHPIVVFKGAPSWRDGGKRAQTELSLVTWVQTLEVKTMSNAGKYAVPSLNLTLLRTDVLNWTLVGGKYDTLTNPAAWEGKWTNYAWSADDSDKDGVIRIQVPVWVPSRTGAPWLRLQYTVVYPRTVYVAVNKTVCETKLVGWNMTPYPTDNQTGYIITPIYEEVCRNVTELVPETIEETMTVTLGTVKFGAQITHVFVLAGSKWASPGVPDTPKAFPVTMVNGSGVGITQTIYGYVVNWNHTAKKVTIDPKEFYPTWTKAGITFRGNNTKVFGDFWNITYWSGASKTVRTLAMDGFCIEVKAPPPCPGEEPKGLADVPVWVEAVGATGKTMEIARARTDATGTVKFAPPAVFAYKFDVPGRIGPQIDYRISTKQNFEDVLKPYDLDEAKANLCPEVLSIIVKFAEKHNEFGECISLAWEAVYLFIEDWSGKPLVNMMVAATKMYPTPSGGITTFDFSREFRGAAVARLLVTPGSAYTVTVYWRDSYLLAAARAIPRYINIYDSFADELTPRLFASKVFTVPGGFVTSAGGTIKTFVYIGLIELRTKEGKALSPQALEKITVTITWPDGVITQVKPGSDGVASIILNRGTVKSWPHPASATYTPESPHPQSPAGDYKVVVEWTGVGKIAEKTLRIHRAKLDTPEVREPVLVDVVDVTISLTTPFNTPMAGASVTVTKLDGTTLTLTADAQGRISVPEVPLGKVDVTVTTWNGLPVNFKATGATAGAVTVGNIGKLVVTVVGARGQGLEGARVSITGTTTIVGTTDAAGKFAVELPAGTYTVTAEKGGRTGSTSVSVAGGQTTEATLKVDVFMTLAGWEMSFSEFVGLLLLIALLAIVLFIIAHEYAVWRRRRLARAIVPAKAEGA